MGLPIARWGEERFQLFLAENFRRHLIPEEARSPGIGTYPETEVALCPVVTVSGRDCGPA